MASETLYRSGMAALVRTEDVYALVGDIGEELTARVVATGATLGEIAQAVVDLEEELAFDECHGSRSPRVLTVRSLLEPVFERRDRVSRGRD